MSAEIELPAELREIERQLQATVLTESSVRMSEVMYLAGWAAAEANLMRVSSQRGWFWPATSGVLGAAVILLGFFLFQEPETPTAIQVVERKQVEPPLAELTTRPAGRHQPRFKLIASWKETAPLLAMRETALWHDIAAIEPRSVSSNEFESLGPTTRELMNVVLPETKPSNPERMVPGWWKKLLGETS